MRVRAKVMVKTSSTKQSTKQPPSLFTQLLGSKEQEQPIQFRGGGAITKVCQ